MSDSPSKKAIDQIRSDFFSADEQVVLHALQRCREQGNRSLLEPLIALYARTDSQTVRQEAADMLNSVKVDQAEEVFMDAALNPDMLGVRRDILSFMWNSGVQPVGWLKDLTNIALTGTLEEVIECITLVESMDDEFPEEQVMDSAQQVRLYLAQAPADEKSKLLAAYLGVLGQLGQF